MYFKAKNGTFKRVPQIPNRFLDGEQGGMTIYYTQGYDNGNVTAFKPVGPSLSALRLPKKNLPRAVLGNFCGAGLLNWKFPWKRASACSRVIPRNVRKPALLSGTAFASAATTLRISAATTALHALIPRLTRSSCLPSHVLAEFAQPSAFQRNQPPPSGPPFRANPTMFKMLIESPPYQKLLGWRKPRQPGPRLPRFLPSKGNLRKQRPLPEHAPRKAPATHVRDRLGHDGI